HCPRCALSCFFLPSTAAAPSATYTLSLHDALPISPTGRLGRFLDADAVGIKGDRLGLGRLRRLGGRGKARVLVWVRVLRVAHVIRLRTGCGRAGPSDARVSPPATGRPDAPPRPARTPRPSRGETASGSGRKTQPDGGSRRATPRAS